MKKPGWTDLAEMEKKAKGIIKDACNASEELINNTINVDLPAIITDIEHCLKDIDSIRKRLTQRAVEYETTIARILMDAGMLPVDLIEAVYRTVAGELAKEINPRILKIIDPFKPSCGENNNNLVEIEIDNYKFPENRVPYLFIHGIEYSDNPCDTFTFFRGFEDVVKMFDKDRTDGPDYSNVDIYLVSYDSKLTDEEETIIRRGFETVLGQVTIGTAPELFAAVIWREYIQRAETTANRTVIPFLQKLADAKLPVNNKGRAITHSLGSYLLAYAGHNLNPTIPIFQSWFCMAAAMPSDAFTSTGKFKNAPRIAGPPRDNENEHIVNHGTSVWYSAIDGVLTFIYPLGTLHFAMGQTGALIPRTALIDYDVTLCVREAHGQKEGYFKRLGPTLRHIFNTQTWPGKPCALSEVLPRNLN